MTTDRPDAVDPELAVRVDALTKTFGTVRALDDVSFRLRRGTLHALLRQTGSGKPTLTKAIAAAHALAPGPVMLPGELLEHLTPRDARRTRARAIEPR